MQILITVIMTWNLIDFLSFRVTTKYLYLQQFHRFLFRFVSFWSWYITVFKIQVIWFLLTFDLLRGGSSHLLLISGYNFSKIKKGVWEADPKFFLQVIHITQRSMWNTWFTCLHSLRLAKESAISIHGSSWQWLCWKECSYGIPL